MRKLLFVIVIGFGCVQAIAQTHKRVDSLLRDADLSQADTFRMKTYERLGDYYSDNNAGKAIEFLRKSKRYRG